MESTTLPSGLQLHVCRQDSVPVASLQAVLPAGALHEEPGAEGLAALTTSLLRSGTRSRTAAAIARQVENRGGAVLAGTDWESSVLMLDLLAEDAAFGVEILADLAWGSCFPQWGFEARRSSRCASLRRRRLHPRVSSLADDHLAHELFRGTRFALPLLGDDTSLGGLSREDVVRFHRRLAPRGAHLLAVGQVAARELADRLAEVPLPAGDPPAPPRHGTAAPVRGRLVLVDMPSVPQAEIRCGFPTGGGAETDFTALDLLNSVLGAGSTSRIPANLRERHGYSYVARSHVENRRLAGAFMVETAVAPERVPAALEEVLSEIERVRQEPLSEDEVLEAQSFLAGGILRSFESHYDLLQWLRKQAAEGLPEDYVDGHLDRLWDFGPQQLLDCAQRHLARERASIVVVGPAHELRRPLARLGHPVTVVPGRLPDRPRPAGDSSPRSCAAAPHASSRQWAAADQSPRSQDERR